VSPFRYIFTKISQYSVLQPIIVGIIHYRRLTPAFRILFYFFVFSLIVETASSNTMKIYGSDNNMPLGHLFFFVEFLVFSIAYFLHLRKTKAARIMIGINLIIGTVVAFTDAFYINDIWILPTLSRPYFSVSIVVYILIYFYFLFKGSLQYNRIDPMFWISAGGLIYFASNWNYFAFNSEWMRDNFPVSNAAWYAHDLLNIIANALYALSFRCFRKQNTV
jgi:hypothetical protein